MVNELWLLQLLGSEVLIYSNINSIGLCCYSVISSLSLQLEDNIKDFHKILKYIQHGLP